MQTNVAIQGGGFFIVGDIENPAYTRAGNFSFDSTGALVTPGGQYVLGYTTLDPLTGEINTSGQPAKIVIPPGVLRAPVPTTLFGAQMNLDASAATGTSYSSSIQIVDSLGVQHVATVTFTKTGAGAWGYTITVPGAEVTGGTPGTPFQIATGSVGFDGAGKLTTVNGAAAADVTVTSPTWADGATPTNFAWDLVDTNNVPAITGYAAPSATSSVAQNGSPSGAATLVTINESGELVASVGVGRSVTVGQLAMATFNNPQGLIKKGTNLFSASQSSGSPSVGVAGTGSRGTLIGAALEQSNVDIAQEFTQMILAQRGYQANSKSITVADELLVDTLNLKR